MEQPTRIELVIDGKTAQALGLVIPASLLAAGGSGGSMIDRRAFIALVFAGIASPRAVGAQQAGRAPTIGVLATTGPSHMFEESLRELGWTEGTTVKFERRFSSDYGKLSRLALELARVPVDIIFAGNAPATRAAIDATRTVPIVTVSGDPVAAGFVGSLARPGANVTGLAIMQTELSGKRLEILTQALPTARRIAVLDNPTNPSTPAMLRETEARAGAFGIQLLRFEATQPERLGDVLAAAARKRPDALVVLSDPMFNRNRRRLIEAAAKHRLPAIWEWREFVEAGGLMAYAPRLDDLYRRAATYVDRILKGARPGDLPVEQATKFELVINLKAAKALGLAVPQSLLLRADEVIQ